jgi:hypothetical protein
VLLDRFPQALQSALAYWSAFRNLGFEPDELYFGFGPVSGVPDCCFIQLKTQGKTFVATAGQLSGTERETVERLWVELANLVNRSESKIALEAFHRHPLGSDFHYYARFATAIRQKGIVIPSLANLSPYKA